MNAIVFENSDERVVVRFRTDRVVLQWLAVTVINSLTVKLHPLYFSGANLHQEFGIVSFVRRLAADTTETLNNRQEYDNDDDKNENIFG